jgi:hypothetical protein
VRRSRAAEVAVQPMMKAHRRTLPAMQLMMRRIAKQYLRAAAVKRMTRCTKCGIANQR